MTYIIKGYQDAATCCRNATQERIQAVRWSGSGSTDHAAHLTSKEIAEKPYEDAEIGLFNSPGATNDECIGLAAFSTHRDTAEWVKQ